MHSEDPPIVQPHVCFSYDRHRLTLDQDILSCHILTMNLRPKPASNNFGLEKLHAGTKNNLPIFKSSQVQSLWVLQFVPIFNVIVYWVISFLCQYLSRLMCLQSNPVWFLFLPKTSHNFSIAHCVRYIGGYMTNLFFLLNHVYRALMNA